MTRRAAAVALCVLAAIVVSACSPGARATSPADPPGVDVAHSIAFSAEHDLAMDACIPADRDEGPFPAAVLIHGGAFREGGRSNMLSLCKRLAAAGIAAFPIDYRLLPASFPAPVDDTVAAVEWLREPEQTARFDLSERISLLGSSAGGIIALTAAHRLAQDGEPVSAVVTLSAAGDLTADARSLGDPDPALEDVVLGYLGCESIEDCPQAAEASPLHNVSDLPPTLLVHGEDELIPIQQAQALEQAMADAGVPVTLLIGERRAHGLQLLDDGIEDEVVRFLVSGTSP